MLEPDQDQSNPLYALLPCLWGPCIVAMMRIMTFNANGLRAAARKGFFSWFLQQDVDILCLQETRAQPEQLRDPLFHPPGYQILHHPAEKKGYSGVALFSRLAITQTQTGIPTAPEFGNEGRWLEAHIGPLTVVSAYLPSGSSSEARQQAKFRYLEALLPYLQTLHKAQRSCIVCGDWNIAHKIMDIKNWKANQKNSGFLPEERAWLDQLFDEVGWVDAFRLKQTVGDHYTWWSNRGRAWENNVGWRIDYQIITPDLAQCVEAVTIYTAARFSDHAPLIIDYALNPDPFTRIADSP